VPSAPAAAEAKTPKRAVRAAETRTLRAPKAAAGGKRR